MTARQLRPRPTARHRPWRISPGRTAPTIRPPTPTDRRTGRVRSHRTTRRFFQHGKSKKGVLKVVLTSGTCPLPVERDLRHGKLMSEQPLVTVVTATTCNPCVLRAIQSVADQSYSAIQHLVVIDNPDASVEIKAAIRQCNVDVIELPYATGRDRFNGHRIYGASAFLGKGDFFCFLDDDNWFDANHVAALIDVVRRGFTWSFSFRKIVDREGNFVCNDDCESLGTWPSVLSEHDYHIDTSCYFLPRMVALYSGHVWFRSEDADRALVRLLRSQHPSYESSYCYSVNYTAGNTPLSVRKEFFLAGNQIMLEKFQGHVPWIKVESRALGHESQ